MKLKRLFKKEKRGVNTVLEHFTKLEIVKLGEESFYNSKPQVDGFPVHFKYSVELEVAGTDIIARLKDNKGLTLLAWNL